MSYPTEAPAYPECGSNDLRARATLQEGNETSAPQRPLPAALDDLHGQLEMLHNDVQALTKRLSPVMGPTQPTAVNPPSPTTEKSKIANAISAGARKVAHTRQILAEINDRLDF